MENKELWTTFEKTGSVVDYLNYKGIRTETQEKDIGENTVESVGYSDRNDTVRDTNR